MWCCATFSVDDGDDTAYYTVEFSAKTEDEAMARAISFTTKAGNVIEQRVTMPHLTYPDIYKMPPEQVAEFRKQSL